MTPFVRGYNHCVVDEMVDESITHIVVLPGSYADKLEVFFGDYARKQPANTVHVPVTECKVGDHFLAIKLRPPLLKGKWVKISIPRHDVIAIFQLENMEDTSKLGF